MRRKSSVQKKEEKKRKKEVGLENFAFEWNGLRKFELKQFKKG